MCNKRKLRWRKHYEISLYFTSVIFFSVFPGYFRLKLYAGIYLRIEVGGHNICGRDVDYMSLFI